MLSILSLLNIDTKELKSDLFRYVIIGAIYGIHYLYFQMGNRIIKKIKHLKPKPNLVSRIITIFHLFGTLSLFCYTGNIGLINSLTFLTIHGVFVIFAYYVFGTKNKQFD
jgi:hypothetical protein